MNIDNQGRIIRAAIFAVALATTTSYTARAQAADATINGPNDALIQTEVTKALDNKRFREVKSTVQNGIVTLTGTVDFYSDKEDADKKTHHRKNVKGVQNLIQVAGPLVEDDQLRNKLAEKLAYDRVGYGTTMFNALTIGVQNGVVTLGGSAYGPTDKDSALSLVANYPGVKDVVDNIQVDPVSPMDDRIRIQEARAVYGAPQLNKYAMDPAKSIRITVVNGNVTLSGVSTTKRTRTWPTSGPTVFPASSRSRTIYRWRVPGQTISPQLVRGRPCLSRAWPFLFNMGAWRVSGRTRQQHWR